MENAKVESLKSGDLKRSWEAIKKLILYMFLPGTFLHELLGFSAMAPNIVIIIKFLLLYTSSTGVYYGTIVLRIQGTLISS